MVVRIAFAHIIFAITCVALIVNLARLHRRLYVQLVQIRAHYLHGVARAPVDGALVRILH